MKAELCSSQSYLQPDSHGWIYNSLIHYILCWFSCLPYCFHFLRSSLIFTGKLFLWNTQSLTRIKTERQRQRERKTERTCMNDSETAWPIPPWNPHIVSPQPMGDSYQNTARTIMKGYGNYGKHTHTQTEQGRPTKHCTNTMCLVWGLFTYPSRALVTFN